jgi:hypothetical protein
MVSSLVISKKVPHDQSLHAISCVNYLDWMEYINIPWKNKRKQKKCMENISLPLPLMLEHLMLETRQPWKSIALNLSDWIATLYKVCCFQNTAHCFF